MRQGDVGLWSLMTQMGSRSFLSYFPTVQSQTEEVNKGGEYFYPPRILLKCLPGVRMEVHKGHMARFSANQTIKSGPIFKNITHIYTQ